MKFSGAENHPPFSLEGCFNLSELTLDMERTDSCIVTTSVNILSTLDPLQRNRLERITLTTSCVHRWFCKGPRTELTRVWGDLDIVLSELTKAAIGMRGKRLTFVLVSTGGHKEGCISFGRKWLPKMLPIFMNWGRCMSIAEKVEFDLPPMTPAFTTADRTVRRKIITILLWIDVVVCCFIPSISKPPLIISLQLAESFMPTLWPASGLYRECILWLIYIRSILSYIKSCVPCLCGHIQRTFHCIKRPIPVIWASGKETPEPRFSFC